MMKKTFSVCTACLLLPVFVLATACTNGFAPAYWSDGLAIPLALEEGNLVVEATIAGISGRFIFDTAKDISYVPEARTGFTLSRTKIFDGTNYVRTGKYRMGNVDFADGSVNTGARLVKKGIKGGMPLAYEGILGRDIFAGYLVELSFSENRIVLHAQIPDRFARAPVLPAIQGRESATVFAVKIDGEEFPMTVSTGLASALLFPESIARNPATGNSRRIASNGRDGDFYLVRTNSVSVKDLEFNGRLVMSNSRAGTGDPSNAAVGQMGTGFMRHYDFLLDQRAAGSPEGIRYIPITKPEERDYGFYSPLDAVPEFGIIATGCSCGCLMDYGCCGADMEIRSVLIDSEAYALGLRPGMTVLSLDGKPVSSLPPNSVTDPYLFDRLTEFTARIDGVEVTLRRER